MALYFLLPPLEILRAFFRGRRGPVALHRSLHKLLVGIAASMFLGIASTVIYGLWLGGAVYPTHVIYTCYWIAGLLCILKWLDLIIDRATRICFGVGKGTRLVVDRQMAAHVLRVVLLFAVGLPYMMIAAATYRPKIIRPQDSLWTELGGESLEFTSTDGLPLHGLWIPAGAPPDQVAPARRLPRRWGRQTVILCPGERSDNPVCIAMAREFTDRGYNVLTFDFRGNGQSSGHLISFGYRERLDVLGGVRCAQAQHPQACQRIVGVGIGAGGAALLGAAVEPVAEGRAISAVVVVGCYDRFDQLAASAVNYYFAPPLGWLTLHVVLPLACVQTDADLRNFSPSDAALSFAPRPLMVIHDVRDRWIPFERGQELYDSAPAPKSHLWLDGTREDGTLDEAANLRIASRSARHFIDIAVPML